jgi:4-hydroxyproline epimerase
MNKIGRVRFKNRMPTEMYKSGQTRIKVIDSHTGGEPTRMVIEGGPDLGGGSVADRLNLLRSEYDWFRRAVVNEPRGSDALVGALLCEPVDPSCAAGVIFFDNATYLGMCGHGTIGLIATLQYLGRIGPGKHSIETPVGPVETLLDESGAVTLNNVASFRQAKRAAVEVDGYGRVTGDIAWGGNWFFLIDEHPFELSMGNIGQLTEFAWAVKQALTHHGVTGAGHQEVDHVALYGAPDVGVADSKNFVLCPGKAYDRSPCGTGTSARLACLYSDGKLAAGTPWRQESIVGSVFEGSISEIDGKLYPTIKGRAHITAAAELILEASDPFRTGIPR